MAVSVGIVGTSWWAEAMYLAALRNHPHAQVSAICGRNAENARQIADRWQIPHVFTDYRALIDSGQVQALIVITPNDSHYAITMRALEAGLHVLCEKPLALNYAQAAQMAELANRQGVKHMVPFTYRFMPTARYLKELIDSGYIGRPYHLNMRYYAGYGRGGDYMWRFDVERAGAGALGDIGSHFMYLAYWYFGRVARLCCLLGHMVQRPPRDPEGRVYTPADDCATIMLEFENGAQGVIQVSTLCYEDTPFEQTHHMEFHGSGGTLYGFIDWDKVQRVSGARDGEGMPKELPVPDHIWLDARRDTVPNTYHDVFREQDWMTRGFIADILKDRPSSPDFHDGAYIQRLIDAAAESHRERRWVEVGL